jgi:hypothetical protein
MPVARGMGSPDLTRIWNPPTRRGETKSPRLPAMSRVGGIDDAVWTLPLGQSTDEGRPSRRQRRVVVALLVLLALGVVYPATAAALSQRDYGTLAFWKVPNRIDYCGRRYYDNGPTQLGRPAQFQNQDSRAGAHWSRLSGTFSGRSIYADTISPSHPVTSCTTFLYIPLGGGRWELYSLSGGP